MKFFTRLYQCVRLRIYRHFAAEFHVVSEAREADLRRELKKEVEVVEALRKEFLEELHLTRSHLAKDLRIVHHDLHVLNGSKYGPERNLKSPVPVEKEQS